MTTRSATRRSATKPAPEPEVVEDEFEDLEDEDTEDGDVEATEDEDDLEDLDEDEAPKPKAKAAPKTTAPKAPKIDFGSAELAAHVTETTGETYDARAIRMLLRKLAKDSKFARIIGEDRSRYSFDGPNDAVCVLVVDMVKSGAAKELKQAGLQAVKDKAAATKAAKAAAKAKEAEEADEMEEVEEEAPKPRTRRAAPAKAAPAKATPATTRRRAATK